jgi:hypothetical protein
MNARQQRTHSERGPRSSLVPTVLRGNAVPDAPRRLASGSCGRRASKTAFPRRPWERVKFPALSRAVAFVIAILAWALPACGQSVRLDVTRDLWVSSVDRETDGNNGGASRLKLKSYQEMSLVDVDPKPLRGRVVTAAALHVRSVGDPPLRRVTVSSLGAPWVEGTGTSYASQAGSSTFRSRIHPDTAWTRDGGDLCRVMLGQGGTLWKMADASPPDRQGWQTIAVDPAVVALRTAGVSEGFVLFDDTGTEWTRSGEKFNVHHMPNRFIYSREQNRASAPYFSVTLGRDDHAPPAAPGDLRQENADLPAGEALVSWTTPHDSGPAGTVGFFVAVAGRPVPRDLIPLAGKPGARVVLRLRDLGLVPGARVVVTIRAVDGAGNSGPAGEVAVRVSSREPKPLPGAAVAVPEPAPGALPKLGAAEVAVIDELDKVDPVSGRMIPAQAPGYLAANHLWTAADGRIRLHAARNEFVAFQVLLTGTANDLSPTLTFDGPASAKLNAEFGRYHLVQAKSGPLPDPIVPLGGPEDVVDQSTGATRQSLHVEVYVPHDAPVGAHNGTLTLRSGGQSLALPVTLEVWDFTLPDSLSFLPEMNCYGLPPNERDFYRLAHRHRTVINRVPYSQAGVVEQGCAPRWDGKSFDWSEYDRRFGPLLDGSAFADLPRKGVPLEIFYLPLHENWPTPIEPNYNGSDWADQAFKPSYRAAFVAASAQFTRHIDGKPWDDTLFLCFFNGKYDFKSRGWSRGSSPWLLDEPQSFSDFWALRYFGAAFHEGVMKARSAPAGAGNAKLVFRCDISRPEWQRDSLDGLLDYNVVGGALRPYRRIVMDRKEAQGQVVLEYSSANPVEESNVQAVGWSLDAWTLGTDGVLPWQTIGRGDSWREADPLALFYPGLRGKAPVPSVRLKAFRRGQQDVEYLTLLALTTGEPRWAVARRVREALELAGSRGGSGLPGQEDAGLIRFGALRPQDLWKLRVQVGQALSDAHPAPRRKLVELRPPPRDPATLATGMAAGATAR